MSEFVTGLLIAFLLVVVAGPVLAVLVGIHWLVWDSAMSTPAKVTLSGLASCATVAAVFGLNRHWDRRP